MRLKWRSAVETEDGLIDIRSRYYPMLGVPAVMALWVPLIASRPDDSEISIDLALVGISVAAILFIVRLFRVRLYEVDDNLVIRNVFLSRAMHWSEVRTIRAKDSLASGEYFGLLGFGRGSYWAWGASATASCSRERARAIHNIVQSVRLSGTSTSKCRLKRW